MSSSHQTIISFLFLLTAVGCQRESTERVVHEETTTSSTSSREAVTNSVETVQVDEQPSDDFRPDTSATQLPNRSKLLPVDEASSDPSFATFRETLKGVVKRKDTTALLAVIDPKIRASFGAENGLPAFRKMWKLDQSDSKLWRELEEVLRLGGSFKTLPDGPKVFWAPYTFSNFPEDGSDAFTTLIVIDSDVPLKSEARASSKTLGTLSHDLVQIASGDRFDGDWRKVVTSNGVSGYLPGAKVRSHIDYRAGFEKKTGQWTMTIFVAGD